jgi:hypothetical protein
LKISEKKNTLCEKKLNLVRKLYDLECKKKPKKISKKYKGSRKKNLILTSEKKITYKNLVLLD